MFAGDDRNCTPHGPREYEGGANRGIVRIHSPALPEMPAYLDPDSYVPVPLEATYATAWINCPDAMRELIERGEQNGLAEETYQPDA
ncbi:MAG: hypothetical protein WD872_09935 [Pirellulaceae bacterium]